MEVKIAYTFDSDAIANRFLNDVRSGTVSGVNAKFYSNSYSVLVYYSADDLQGDFDDRTAKLDDLASQYQGREVSL